MNNAEIAGIFRDIADLLEIKGENVFKVRAYQRAARGIENLPQEIESMVQTSKDLQEIPGVGEAIAGKIDEIINTGKLKYYEELKSEFPAGITTLLEIPGIGPKTAKKLSDEGIDSIDELEKAINNGRFAGMFRLGEKIAENILHQIQNLRRKDQRIPIGEAVQTVDEIFESLKKVPGVRNLTPAGSLRRFKDTIGDIDLMGTADKPEAVINTFVRLPLVAKAVSHGPTKASVLLKTGLQVDLRMVEHDSFGSLLQYFTGSKQHNIELRTKAVKKGLSLSEYGITNMATNRLEKYATEEDFYARLGMQYIPPEIREAQGEIELAEKGKIPELIEISDIKGDFHVHTNWSDGQNSLEDMVRAAKALGYGFIAITDHSKGLGIALGLDVERQEKQITEKDKVSKSVKGIKVLIGTEVDIRADGRMDLPEEMLNRLDLVIAAIHSGMNESKEKMTKRVLKALEHPGIDILAHPTCRIIGSREPVAIDIEAVYKAALKYNKALEINAMPNRLDLKDVHIQRARELGVKLVIGTDSHSTVQLGYMRFGVGIARRGWCTAEDLLNTWKIERILGYLVKKIMSSHIEKMVKNNITNPDDLKAINHMRESIREGKNWYIALLEAIRIWNSTEENYRRRNYKYLIDSEAFDWLLLAERLLDEVKDLVPEKEMTNLLFFDKPPQELTNDQFKSLIGTAKYKAYLNYTYGVLVEEALLSAMVEEVRKERRSAGTTKDEGVLEKAYQRIYGNSEEMLFKQFLKDKGYLRKKNFSLSDIKEFRYWLFKYRVKHSDSSRVASDTRKALLHLQKTIQHRKNIK